MSSHDTGDNEALAPSFVESESVHPKLFVAVPSSLPYLNRRRSSGLNRSRFGVGVEGPCYQDEPTGQVWAAWVVLGIAVSMAMPGLVVVWTTGDWVLAAIAAPFAGLFLAGMFRMICEEQAARKKKVAKKIERMNRRLRDMNH